MNHSFKIRAGITSNDSVIEMDGQPLKGVTRVSFELAANSITILKLEIMGEVLVEGEFRKSAIVQVAQINPDYRGN